MRMAWILLVAVLVSGCTSSGNVKVMLMDAGAGGYQLVQEAVAENFPELPVSERINLDRLAKDLSAVGTYAVNENDCTDYTLRFIGNATEQGFKCRYVSGYGLGACHAWAECETKSGLLTIEATQTPNTWDFTNYGEEGNKTIPRAGVVDLHYFNYTALCWANWSDNSWPADCENSVCREVERLK